MQCADTGSCLVRSCLPTPPRCAATLPNDGPHTVKLRHAGLDMTVSAVFAAFKRET